MTSSWRMVTAEEPGISDLKLLFSNFIIRPRFRGSLWAVAAGSAVFLVCLSNQFLSLFPHPCPAPKRMAKLKHSAAAHLP